MAASLPPRFEREKVARWHAMYGRTILADYRRAAPADPKYAAAPTFREFVEYLVELPIDQFDAHWKPVYLLPGQHDSSSHLRWSP